MADIALRSYFEEIDGLIDGSRVEEAIAHLKHILGIYPKALDAYRLMAKALLEKNRHLDAADVFQRVLSSVPDDFIAHIGMAVVREDEGNIDAAIWHMERAYEVQPSSGPIQEELRRLYGKRDGSEPPRLRLSRAALARMYDKGDLYQQAIGELRVALRDEPDRLDLKVMLASALWRSRQRSEAAETSAKLLEILPYCREANRILADVWTEAGRPEEAKNYRRRLEALDPYEAFADAAHNGHGAVMVAAEQVSVPHLDVVYGESAPDASRPDWMEALGIQYDQPAAAEQAAPGSEWLSGLASAPAADQSAAPAQPLPGTDWLSTIRGEGLPATGPLTAPPASSSPGQAPAETPDWLSGLGVAEPKTAADQAPGKSDEPAADWVSDVFGQTGTVPPAGTEPRAGTGMTGWLAALAGEPEVTPAPSAQEADVPDWLRAEQSAGSLPIPATEAQATAPQSGSPADDVPDWLTGVSSSAGSSTPAASNLEEAEPWSAEAEARKMAATMPLGQDYSDSSAPVESDGLPDWLQTAGPGSQPEEAQASQVEANHFGGVPDWLTSAPGIAAPAASVPDNAETASVSSQPAELPDWLAGAPAGSAAESKAQSTPPAGDLPDWLTDTPADGTLPADESLPWLTASRSAQPPALPASGPGDQEPVEEVPDWLRSPGTVQATSSEPAESTGTPAWLSDVAQDSADNQSPADSNLPAWLAQSAPSSPTAESAGSALDWLQADEAPVANAPEDVPSWLNSAQSEPAAADLPGWLANSKAEPAAPARSTEEAGLTPEAKAVEMARAEEEIPDWMKSAGWAPRDPSIPLDGVPAVVPEPVPDEPSDGAARAEMPDWLQALKPPDESRTAAKASADAPDWLRQAMEGAPDGQSEAAVVGSPSESILPASDDLPDWLKASDESSDDMPAAAASAAAIPDWLESNKLPAAAGDEAPIVSTVPDWLQTSSQNPADVVASYLKDQAGPQPELETPASKTEPAASPAEMSADEAMAWLESLAAQHGAKEEELVTRRAPQPMASDYSEELTEATPPLQPLPAASAVAQPEPDLPLQLPERAAAEAELTAAPASQTPDLAPVLSEPVEPVSAGVPDGTQFAEAQTAAEAAVPSAANTPQAAPTPAAMSDDEALAWLEGLAARQGARPEELVSGLSGEPEPAGEPSLAPELGAVAEDEQALALLDSIDTPSADPTAALQETPPAAAPEAAVANIIPEAVDAGGTSEMSADQAMAWLESLAARQGASSDELVTAPETRSEDMPEWVRQEASSSQLDTEPAESETAPAAAETPTAADLIPGSGGSFAETEGTSAEPLPQPEMDADQAMAWLETLAARQGAAAEELVTSPETRSEKTPEWIAAQSEAALSPIEAGAEETPAEPVQADSPAAEKPDWLAQMEAEADAYEASAQGLPAPAEVPPVPGWLNETSSSVGELPAESAFVESTADELPDWLKSNVPEEEIDVPLPRLVPAWKSAEPVQPAASEQAAGPEAQPEAEIPDWLKAPGPEPVEEPQPRIVPAWKPSPAAAEEEPAAQPAPASPGVDEELPDWLKPEAAAAEAEALPSWLDNKPVEPQEPVWLPMAEKPQEESAAGTKPPRKPKSPRKPRPSRAKPKQSDETAQLLLKARRDLAASDLTAALITYGDLVGSGHFNSEIIADLEAANRQQPGHPELLRTLGDAYMRDNQLQKALDAYKRALQQL